MFYKGNIQYEDPDTAINTLIKEVIREDSYGLRTLLRQMKDPADIKTIIDIGANVGVFSLFARFLFPTARIIAIEPCSDTFELLKTNVNLFDIETYQLALGRHEMVYLKQRKNNSTVNTFTNVETGAEAVQSVTLEDIFRVGKIEEPYALKIDCEGGEVWLPENKSHNAILSNALYVGMEVHLGYFREQQDSWTAWFRGLFDDRHSVESVSLWNGGVYNYRIMQRQYLRT